QRSQPKLLFLAPKPERQSSKDFRSGCDESLASKGPQHVLERRMEKHDDRSTDVVSRCFLFGAGTLSDRAAWQCQSDESIDPLHVRKETRPEKRRFIGAIHHSPTRAPG